VLLIRGELGNEERVEMSSVGPLSDWVAEWAPSCPGPFELVLSWKSQNGMQFGPPFSMVVDPVLSINRQHLPAKSIVQLTELSRLAGPIEQWPEALAPQAKLGYNMVHFTPIQPPGESGSCYSLDDQSTVDDSLMATPSIGKKERLDIVRQSVKRLEKEQGMLSAMDIVLNHTSGTSPWLLDHPECAYNLSNSPHLTAAAELDEKLAWYSSELQDGRLGGPHISSQHDVDRVMEGVRKHVLGVLNLREYFCVNDAACFDARGRSTADFERNDYEALKQSALPSIGVQRQGVVVDGAAARRFCRDDQILREYLARLKLDLHQTYDGIEFDILDAIRGVISYERLELKNGPVGDGHLALVPRYFRRLHLSAVGEKLHQKPSEVVAHNGWVMGWPATEDFGAPNWRFVYLRRHLCAWGDCVKLKYGSQPSEVPFLWDFMTQYAVSMAGIFHAIRLDNAHSTPLHVSQHVLARVRKENPQVWIFAELFTGDFKTDLHYQKTLGINALIREAMQCDHPGDIASKLSSNLWGAHPIGALSFVPALDRSPTEPSKNGPMGGRSTSFATISASSLPLRPRNCPALLFDCTHDNQMPKEKRHARDSLPNAALVAASCASIGSVRGYDELFPFNPSVVFERRPYRKFQNIENLTLGWPELRSREQASQLPEPVMEPADHVLVWTRGAQESVVARGAWDGWQKDLPLKRLSDGRW
jgi:glycogen debranching enzyme